MNHNSSKFIFNGSNCFRIRIMLSILSGKPIFIKNIRLKDEQIGLRDYEINFLKLMVTISNGSRFEIDETGTKLSFKPGLLIGGTFDHECDLERNISYFLEPILCFAPFCKVPIEANFFGITNDQIDISVDTIKHSSLPLMAKVLSILDTTDIELKINARGMPPNGGGSIFFKCPIKFNLKPIQLTKCGKIKRIRGVAIATRVSPQIANRMVNKAKGLLLNYIPDVYIYTDHFRGKNSGKSPGFGLALVAETTEKNFFTGEAYSNPSGSEKGPSLPEDVAQKATFDLFEDIYRGGCVNSCNQGLLCLYMALGQTDVSKVMLGPLSSYTIQLLKHMKEIFQLVFKLDVQNELNEEIYQKGSKKILATCVGVGYSNLSKTVI